MDYLRDQAKPTQKAVKELVEFDQKMQILTGLDMLALKAAKDQEGFESD